MTKKPEIYKLGKRQYLQQMAQVKLDVCMNVNKSILNALHKLNSKWIKDLNIKADTLDLTEEKVGTNLEYTGTGVTAFCTERQSTVQAFR